MLSEIFMEFQSKGDRSKAGSQTDQLVDWRIENVEDRKRRLALLEIDGFKKTMGFPLDVFVKEALAARYPKDGKPVEHTDRRDGRYRSAQRCWPQDHARPSQGRTEPMGVRHATSGDRGNWATVAQHWHVLWPLWPHELPGAFL